MTICITHPGKIGDLLYSTPAAWALRQRHGGSQIDWITSEYCRSLKPLLEYQEAIRHVIIPESYTIEGYGQGVIPSIMPVPDIEQYEAVYQLGISGWPETDMISYFANKVGITPTNYYFQYPDKVDGFDLSGNIMIVCNDRRTGNEYREAVIAENRNRFRIIQIGWIGEQPMAGVENNDRPINFDFLQVATLFSRARYYIGATGAASVLAQAFPNCHSIIVGAGVDHRHYPSFPHLTVVFNPTLDEYMREVRKVIYDRG